MRLALFIAALGSAVAAIALMGPRRAAPPAFSPAARVLKAAAPEPAAYGRVPDFELVDQAGRRVRRGDLRGPWLASFLFTRCSGQCPMLTAQLGALAPRLEGVRLVSFSVDPSDTPAELSAYARRLGAGKAGSGWTFLTGGPGVVERLAREGFKLPVAEGSDPREPILHSSRLVLVDPSGFIRGYFDASEAASRDELLRRAAELR